MSKNKIKWNQPEVNQIYKPVYMGSNQNVENSS